MASKLLTYIQGLSGNPTALNLFQTNPAKAAKDAGLSPQETEALLSKDPGKIKAAIKAGGVGTLSPEEDVVVVVAVVVVA